MCFLGLKILAALSKLRSEVTAYLLSALTQATANT